eukprot:3431981-Ditylum_brightwellii.AAC.1
MGFWEVPSINIPQKHCDQDELLMSTWLIKRAISHLIYSSQQQPLPAGYLPHLSAPTNSTRLV